MLPVAPFAPSPAVVQRPVLRLVEFQPYTMVPKVDPLTPPGQLRGQAEVAMVYTAIMSLPRYEEC